MAKGRDAKGKSKKKKSLRRTVWGVGAVPFPVPVEDARGPVRFVLCVLRPGHQVVGYAISDAVDEAEVRREIIAAVRRAIAEPAFGKRGAPDKIFVSDATLAAELREAVPVEVAVGPTPELARVARAFAQSLSRGGAGDRGEQPSYLAGGVAPSTIERLFEASAELFDAGPWEILTEDAPLRVDVPRLGLTGMRGIVIGGLGESFGFLMFPSDDAYDAFIEMSEQGPRGLGPRMSRSVSYLALSFDRPEEMPPRLVEEIRRFDWLVPSEDALPWIARVDRGELVPLLHERDALVVTLAARALTRLLVDHEAVLLGDVDWPGPISGKASHAGVDVVVTLPELEGIDVYDYDDLDDLDDIDGEGSLDPRHVLDGELATRMQVFALRTFGNEWRAHEDLFEPHPAIAQIAVPWSLYEHVVGGRRVVEHFLAAHGSTLDDEARAWLAAQTRSWLSVWEVVGVERGVGLSLRDLLTGERREVREVKGSLAVPLREAVLARVVDGGAESVLSGLHPRSLAPREAKDVVDAMRSHLRVKGEAPIARLREPEIALALLLVWQEAVRADDELRAAPKVVVNTDGEPLLFTTDRYRLATADVAGIEAALAEIEGVMAPSPDDAERVFVLSRPGNAMHAGMDNTTIGVIRIDEREGRLEIETNSIARADLVRAMVEDSLGARVVHEARAQMDPTSPKARGAAQESKARRPATPPTEEEQREVHAIIRQMKEKHYATWLDHPLPALDGRTPRKAAQTKKGREAVDLLLREMERGESMQPAEQRFDVGALRRELGWMS